MERYTFTDPAVQAALSNTVLLRANVTQNNADDQALLQRFGIFGPPTIAFYGTDGSERAAAPDRPAGGTSCASRLGRGGIHRLPIAATAAACVRGHQAPRAAPS